MLVDFALLAAEACCLASRLMWDHTNLAVMRCLVAAMPGCDMECRLSNTRRRIAGVTIGLCFPVEVSHIRLNAVGVKGTASSASLEVSGWLVTPCSSDSVVWS